MSEKNKARSGAATPERAEDRQTYTDTATNPVYKSTTSAPAGQRSIADLLGVGAANGLTNRQLQQLTGLDSRSVQLRIQFERLYGAPICSDTVNGFYLPANAEEKARCVRSLRSRSREIWRAAAALDGVADEGQLAIEGTERAGIDEGDE